jgi:hypothetical protein
MALTRRRTIRIMVGVVLVGELVKHLLSSEYGPYDRLLELGVFFLILWEIVNPIAIFRHARRRKRLRKVEMVVRDFIASGEDVKRRAPLTFTPEWATSVDVWVREVGS